MTLIGTALIVCAGSAFAQSTQPVDPDGAFDASQLGSDDSATDWRGIRTEMNSVPSVSIEETVSMGLRAFNLASGDLGMYTTGGSVVAMIGQTVSLGTSPSGVEIFAEWNEMPAGDNRMIEARFWTADDSAMLPFGTEVGGTIAQALAWEFGVGDAVDFGPWLDGLNILQSTLQARRPTDPNGFFPIIRDVTANFGAMGDSVWTLADGGIDTGSPLISDTSLPDAFSEFKVQYLFSAVPAPGSAIVLLGGLALTRRRR
ncbi:MAG: hypothetical protein ACF8SC_08235 [Phycisphaerales bacterium JB037]